MKFRSKTIFAAVSACLIFTAIANAQVGPDGNLAYTVSDSLQANSGANNLEKMVIRNRMDSCNTWTASAEAMFMTRSGGASTTLLQNADSTELLNSNGIFFPWGVGERVSIVGEEIFFGCDVEAAFFDIGLTANKEVAVPDAGGSFMVFDQPQFGLFFGDTVNYRYLSQLRSAEINLRHPIWQRLNVLAGFRYMELHEDFTGTISGLDYLDANTDNHLYGGQIGMNVAIINGFLFSLEGTVKAGVYANYADLTMSVRDTGLYGDATTHTAIFGEIGLTGIMQITQYLSLKGGYQVMWLDGVALAGDQPERVNPLNPKPYMGGTMLLHGATAGIEYAF